MSTHLAASPVAEALYGVLVADATLAGLLPGGLTDDVPQDPTFPFGWSEIFTEEDRRGLGEGGLPELDVRIHVYSAFGGKAEAQAAIDRILVLLKDAVLTITGWTHCGKVFYDRTVTLQDEELSGVKCHELIAMFRIFVEES